MICKKQYIPISNHTNIWRALLYLIITRLISAINATTLSAKLTTAQTGLTANDFTILVDGVAVTPTAVVADATGANYTFTITNLDGKTGKVSINGTEVTYNFTDITVNSVKAITTEIFQNTKTALQFAINGETEAADVTSLEKAGYIVSYEATVAVTAGEVTTNTPSFEYKVIISKDGNVVAESALQTVKTLNPASPAKITAHTITNGAVEVGTLVVGDTGLSVNVKEYKTLAGTTVLTSETDLVGEEYKSSNTGVVVVNKTTGAIIPVAEGTANITITKDGLDTYTIPVTVKAAARTATVATTENVSLSSTDASKAITVKVVDQYGDPVQGATVYALPTKTGDNALVATAQSTTATDIKGETTVTITRANDQVTSGSDTVKLAVTNDATKAIGQFAVDYAKAGNIQSYQLRLATNSVSKDATIDYAATETGKEDNTLTLQLVGKDANNIVGALYTVSQVDATNFIATDGTKNFTIQLTGDTAAVNASVANGNLVVNATAMKTGTVKVVVKETSLTRATYDITVLNNTKPILVAGTTSALFSAQDTQLVGGGFTVADEIGTNDFEAKLIYTDGNAPISLQNLVLTFNAPVKVNNITVGNVALNSDQIGELILNTGYNFLATYADTITLTPINTKINDLVALGSQVKVTVVNESGITNTYTFNLEKATQ